jgi:hypothetical protein
MLLPRFSIRTALGILTGVAVLSLFAGQALGGRAWALGLTVAAVSVPAALAVHALFFALASAFANLLGPEEIVALTRRGGVQRGEGPTAPLPAAGDVESQLSSAPTPAAP